LVAEYESELGFADLEDVVRGVLGDAKVPLLFGYRVRLGIV
jgi:hypothetical protein